MRSVELPYAKSIANRLMVLRAVRGQVLPEPDALWSEDMFAMRRVLNPEPTVDHGLVARAGPAGTAYRFGMAFWAAQPRARVLLTADEQLLNRPIQPLVDALRSMGANLETDRLGWRIQGAPLKGGHVAIDSRLSSQFASALHLISDRCSAPLRLEFPKGLASAPYLAMTETLSLERITTWPPERDWSAAFIFLAAVGLTGHEVRLEGLHPSLLQGDARCLEWGAQFGFDAILEGSALRAVPRRAERGPWHADFGASPDLAMPAIVAAALGGRSGRATGLHTLNAKESPRLDATSQWLEALGCPVRKGPDVLEWGAPRALQTEAISLDALNDHRMAFCAALISLRRPVELVGREAVAKSFPDFWRQFDLVR